MILRFYDSVILWPRLWGPFEHLGVYECWSVFKNHILEAQQQAVPLCHKSGKQSSRLTWLNRELIMNLERKKKLYDVWNQGQASQEDIRAVICIWRAKAHKAKTQRWNWTVLFLIRGKAFWSMLVVRGGLMKTFDQYLLKMVTWLVGMNKQWRHSVHFLPQALIILIDLGLSGSPSWRTVSVGTVTSRLWTLKL